MLRQRPVLFTVLSLLLASLACNAFAGSSGVEPSLELPPPAITSEAGTPGAANTPTDGLAPTATLPGGDADAPSDADGHPMVRVLVDLNVRSGPGVQYDRVGFLLQNETAPIVGRDPDSGWWKITCPANVTAVTACWISGGAQYSQAQNADGVPVAAVPPTPTPRPTVTPTPPPEEDESPDTESVVLAANGLLVYVDNNGLWAVRLDLSQNPPTAGEPRQLVARVDITDVAISPDGQRVAYLAGPYENNYLAVVDVDDSQNQVLVQAADVAAPTAVDQSGRLLAMQWLADGRSLAFNTIIVQVPGIGDTPQGDLWTASVDGAVAERLPPGSIGPVFDVAANGRIVSGDAERIVRADLNGGQPETVIEFELVNTASEYIYYPQPRWTADSSRAYVAVPNREQWGPAAGVTFWQIPASGDAESLTTVPGNILFGGAAWTDSGNRLAYVVLPMTTSDATAELSWADGNGRNAVPYAANQEIALHGWNDTGDAFLYSAPSYYAVGRPDATPTQIVIEERPLGMGWLTSDDFVVVAGARGGWTAQSSNLDGDNAQLVQFASDTAVFDVWTP